jgi:DNA-binding MarR family transcriptional regulator
MKTEDPYQLAFVQLMRTADRLMLELAELLRPYDVSPTQYNVLRILRGAGKQPMNCVEIADRMISRDPDITRLLDRMQARGLISRERSVEDRRAVYVTLTAESQSILRSLDKSVKDLHVAQFQRLGAGGAEALTGMLKLLGE